MTAFTPAADRRNALDRAHVGDIEGALGTVRAFDTGPRLSAKRKLGTLLAVSGPGIVVMLADNDAGTFSVFAQAGQNRGTRLLWVLAVLVPALYVTQEMAVRLGAATGAGHARLTLERFGRVWCAFSLGDLLLLNLATLVVEFIGVALAMSYFGVSRTVAVPLAAALLIAVTASGSFRRWERVMYLLVIGNVLLIPLALLHHPRVASVGAGLIPTLGGGNTSSTVLLLVALIGTTIVPWQLFFQQSSIVDKRITPRWLAYERADTAIGALLFAASVAAVLILSATVVADHPHSAQFTDVGAVARAVGSQLGGTAGAVFAVALFNASLLCAATVSLSGAYATAEVFGFKHSLHRRWSRAKPFQLCVAAVVALAAAIALTPGLPLGTVTTLVQACAGILLPSTLVLLLILCNDTELLGPLTNGWLLNAAAAAVIALILGLSTTLAIVTAFPHLGLAVALLAAGAMLAAGATALGLSILRARPRRARPSGLTPWQRQTWTTPPLELVPPTARTAPRLMALALLRAYVALIAAPLLLKLVGVLH